MLSTTLFLACAFVGADGPDLQGTIQQLFSNPDAGARQRCVISLGRMGDKAKPAVRALCQSLLYDKSQAVRLSAAEAIEKIHPELYKHIITLMREKDSERHLDSIIAIAEMGKDGTGALQILLNHLQHNLQALGNLEQSQIAAANKVFEDKEPVLVTRFILRRYGDTTEGFASTEVLKKEPIEVSRERYKEISERLDRVHQLVIFNVEALVHLARSDPSVVRALIDMADHGFVSCRLVALEHLCSIAESYPVHKEKVIRRLCKSLDNPSADEKMLAMQALVNFGKDARSALVKLKALKIGASSEKIREEAAKAVKAIEDAR